MENCLQEHLRDFSVNLKPEIVVVYKGEEPITYVSVNKEKEKVLIELLSLLARKFLKSEEILGEQEFLYAEGKDYDIFIIDIKDDYLIVSFFTRKEKFSLLKLEHEKLKNKLLKCFQSEEQNLQETAPQEELLQEPVIEELEEVLTQQEPIIEPEESEETLFISETSPTETPNKEIETTFSEKQDEVLESPDEEVQEPVEKLYEEEIQSAEPQTELEKEFIPEFENEEKIDKVVLDDIKVAFLKEIGPVGKLIFNRKLQKFSFTEEIPKSKLEKFINDLAEDIIEEDRKQDFIKTCSQYLK